MLKLCFVNLAPSAGLENVLLAQGISLDLAKKLPSEGEYDLIALKPKTDLQLKELSTTRERFPKAWLVVVVTKTELKNSDYLKGLLKQESMNEIWLEEAWESLFWLSLQHAVREQKRELERETLLQENESLRQQCDELMARSSKLVQQIEKDVELAGNLQRSILPKAHPRIPGVSIAVKYIPAAGLGGDYYDIFEFGDKRRYGIILADSKTHGLAAAFLSVLLKIRLEEMKDRFPDTKSFVEFLNKEIQAVHEKEMASMSLLFAILDRSALTLHFTSAGKMGVFLWRANGSPAIPDSTSPPLGGTHVYPFTENSIKLEPGDLLVLYTDGLHAPLGSPAGDRIRELLRARKTAPTPQELQNELMGLIDRHVEDHALTDDLTVIHFGIDERVMYLAHEDKKEQKG